MDKGDVAVEARNQDAPPVGGAEQRPRTPLGWSVAGQVGVGVGDDDHGIEWVGAGVSMITILSVIRNCNERHQGHQKC